MSVVPGIRTWANADIDWDSFFWNSGLVGMIQHEDFWDLVSQKVNVYQSNLSGTVTKSIILNDGRKVLTDVLLCGTGWNTNYPFFSSKQVYELGLPHDLCKGSEEERRCWNDRIDVADRQILKEYPILARLPPDCKPIGDASLTPARLYHGIASLTDTFPWASSSVQQLSGCRSSSHLGNCLLG